MLKDEFCHVQPRPFQISAIATLVRRSGQTNPSLLLVQKTGHCKSLVPLGALMMLGGVAIVVVPFHAIGTGQASSSTSVSEYLECGVLSGTNFVRRREKVLRARLLSCTGRKEDRRIMMYVFPAALDSEELRDCLTALFTRGLVSLVAVDEAHHVYGWIVTSVPSSGG